MKKAYILSGSVAFFALGLLFLILSSISGVSSAEIKRKQTSTVGERYMVEAYTVLHVRGIFPIKNAKLRYQFYDGHGKLLAQRDVSTSEASHEFTATYYTSDWGGQIPSRIEVEVVRAEFNNAFLIVISALIMIASAITFIVYKKRG